MKRGAAYAEWIIDVLIRPSAETVERDGEAFYAEFGHDASLLRLTTKLELKGLGSNFAQCSWRQLCECCQDGWYRNRQVIDTVAAGEHNEYRDGQGSEVLLVLHTFVGGKQHVELTGCERKKLAVFDAGPASALNGDR
jgi:hypothetical protein